MWFFNKNILPINRATQINREYWKLQEVLPEDERFPVETMYDIQRYKLMYRIGFIDMSLYRGHRDRDLHPSEWFEIEIIDLSVGEEFEVRVGIVRKSGKEIAVSNAAVISAEKKTTTAVIRLIRRLELQKIMQSYKELELFVEIDEKDVQREEKNKFYMQMQKFRMDYKELLLSGRNSDFIINVERTKFQVHKLILGARSPVFLAMMEHDMKEKASGEVSIIDTNPVVFQEFLLYLYTGDEEHLDWKNIVELYKLGDKYCVEDLKYLCVVRMKTHISIENFVQVFYISQQLNNVELSECAIQFFLEDLKEIVASEEYIEFKKGHPKEVSVLVKALEPNNLK